ncbi:ABC transporter substrate-binding protein [Limobrevibacterium gyesilva]|uniref:ABC transporter substrate-binding protein n=1 Tax=Limobrevibacterium gyesilva TaxID=2991712 RepID=A0AA41YRB3_9PROT|nr:ABC transporter substrate-binding protein [Limobrevibacterium gyesilva]MCW3475075.1 ABC transporter substrate-binding protein [Limobrevibacterium gyesilva]
MRFHFKAMLGAMAALALAVPAQAADLKLALSSSPSAMDPQFHNLGANLNVAQNMFDTLVRMDADSRLMPWLAESWRVIDDRTWEFRLRKDVRFHDGTKLTADDVIWSLDRPATLVNSPAGFGIYTRSIATKTAVDATTLRITTNGPYPLLLSDLSVIYILNRKATEGLAAEDFARGKGMVGTGPYRFVSFQRDDRVELARNDTAWGTGPAWDHVSVRFIPNNASRLAALLSGDVDAIEGVPTADLAQVKANPKLVYAQKVSGRLVYFYVDSGRADTPQVTARDGGKLAKNPLADERVRRAMSMAINREAIADRVMAGLGYPTNNLVPETLFGYDPTLTVVKFDPEGAKRLLAEAGYPDGFALTIHGPNDRLVNDAQIVQAVAQMLTRIGIAAKVETIPMASYASRGAKGEFSFGLIGFGSQTGESSSILRAIIACQNPKSGGGLYNWSHYCNPQVDDYLTRALATVDDQARLDLLRKAAHLAVTTEAIIPLHFQATTWAARKGIAIEPRTDERTFAASFRPVP